MKTPLVLLAVLSLALPHNSESQMIDRIQKQFTLYGESAGLLEGYVEALAGEAISYARLRSDCSTALLTRATDGTMAIEWQTAPVTLGPGQQETTFFLMAGIQGQTVDVPFAFALNGREHLVFRTTRCDQWETKGTDGVLFRFDTMLRDQFNDAFGYLRISVPAKLLTAGVSARMKIVGQKAGLNTWFMVYECPDALAFFRRQSESEGWFTVRCDRDRRFSIHTSDNWSGRPVLAKIGDSLFPGGVDVQLPGSVEELKNSRFMVFVDGYNLLNIGGMYKAIEQNDVHGDRFSSSKGSVDREGNWTLKTEVIFDSHLGPILASVSDSPARNGMIDVMVSSHQDIAWMDSPEQCRADRDTKIITPAIKRLEEVPAFRFDMENTLSLMEYLDRHPESRELLHRLAKERRLAWGATYTQPYEDLCSSEMLVRQFSLGRKWFKRTFPGCDTRVAWNMDVPSRSLQMPQVMAKAGVPFFLISRHRKGAFRWSSPDGSGVLVYSPGHYALSGEAFTDGMGKKLQHLAAIAEEWKLYSVPHKRPPVLPLVFMSDMSAPISYADLFEEWNDLKSIYRSDGSIQPLTLPHVQHASAEEFMEALSAESDTLPGIMGERPNVWLYIHGPTHHWAISAKRQADWLLPAAETFSTIEALLAKSFKSYPEERLSAAWAAQIYPDHGWGGKNGHITDSTFRAKYEFARDTGEELFANAIRFIANRIKVKRAEGVPIIIYNVLSWKRSSPVTLSADFPEGQCRAFTLHDASGHQVPAQLLSAKYHSDGSLKKAQFVFVAEDIPSIGYRTFYLHPDQHPAKVPGEMAGEAGSAENRFYRIGLGGGGVSGIFDKEFKREVLDTRKFLGGELFTLQSVGTGAGEFAEIQQPTMEGFDKLSNYSPVWHRTESGPVRSVFSMEQSIPGVTIVQRIVLYHGIKRIDLQTSLLKWDGMPYREFRLAFPVNAPSGRVAYEVPFGTVEIGKDELRDPAGERYVQRPCEVHPRSIQRWISVSDDRMGVTFASSVAVWDHIDPTGSPSASPLLQPILLASRRSCHPEGNWYTQEGDHEFTFSMTSHEAGWDHAYRFGVGAATPLGVVYDPHTHPDADLPEEKEFFSVSARNIMVSTVKKCDDDNNVIVRLYEAEGKDTDVAVRCMVPIQNAEQTNIIEEDGRKIRAHGNELQIRVGHHAIETFKWKASQERASRG